MKQVLISFILIILCIGIIGNVNAQNVPDWVKNTAGWWADDSISENEFITAIEFLINEGIIQVQAYNNSENKETAPDWVKNTAGWWADDSISENEFVTAIEFLINDNIISVSPIENKCNSNEDKNSNGIPDTIEKNITIDDNADDYFAIKDRDWKNCIITGNFTHIKFVNIDFTNAQFLDFYLTDGLFVESILDNSKFLNGSLYGVSFYLNELSNVSFENIDFYPETWIHNYYVGSYDDSEIIFSCKKIPCILTTMNYKGYFEGKSIYDAYFGINQVPVNLELMDVINDESDRKSIWKKVTTFIVSDFRDVNFQNSTLEHVIFGPEITMTNVDFTNSNFYQVIFRNAIIENIIFPEGNIINERSIIENEKITANFHIEPRKIDTVKNFENIENNHLEIKFLTDLDEGRLDWPSDLSIHNKNLIVADTDNHRVIKYNLDTLDQILEFTSPIQNYCKTTNAYIVGDTNCPAKLRNLPTSVTYLSEKYYVSYGFQNEIQSFDENSGNIKQFGSFGSSKGKFNEAFHISSFNNKLFVSDSKNQRIQIFDLDGEFLDEISTNVNGITDSVPYNLDIYDDRVYVVDRNNSTILIFNLDWVLIEKIEVNPDISNSSLSGIDVNDEMIFVADAGANMITIFDLDGNRLVDFGKFGERFGEFNSPQSIVSDGDKIFVADASNHRIQIFILENIE